MEVGAGGVFEEGPHVGFALVNEGSSRKVRCGTEDGCYLGFGLGDGAFNFREHGKSWVNECAKVAENGSGAEGWMDNGAVLLGGVKEDAVGVAPRVDVAL